MIGMPPSPREYHAPLGRLDVAPGPGGWQDRGTPLCDPAMALPLIYHDDYSPAFPPEHRFPMDKFRLREGKICID